MSKQGAIHPTIEVLHRNKHAVQFYNCTFTIAQGGGKKGYWIVFSSPALFHCD
jgi:hypothetical protein